MLNDSSFVPPRSFCSFLERPPRAAYSVSIFRLSMTPVLTSCAPRSPQRTGRMTPPGGNTLSSKFASCGDAFSPAVYTHAPARMTAETKMLMGRTLLFFITAVNKFIDDVSDSPLLLLFLESRHVNELQPQRPEERVCLIRLAECFLRLGAL